MLVLALAPGCVSRPRSGWLDEIPSRPATTPGSTVPPLPNIAAPRVTPQPTALQPPNPLASYPQLLAPQPLAPQPANPQPVAAPPQLVAIPAAAGPLRSAAPLAPSGVVLASASATMAEPDDVPVRLPPVDYEPPAFAAVSTLAQDSLTAQPPAEALPGTPEAEDIEARRRAERRLKIPSQLPGANAPPIILPPSDFEHPEERRSIIDKLFPSPGEVRPIPWPSAEPGAPATTLAQLEAMATANNPLLVQAAGDVTAARGAAVQAGVHPNPVVGYEADTVGSSFTRNYQGVFGTQTIKTAGKLGLARAAANMALMNAEIQLRQTRIDVLTQVRANYYAVLVAREGLLRDTALERFTMKVYTIQVEKLKGGEGTGYEPAQLRAIVMQARAAVIQSQNRFVSAWKQLGASVGIPNLPPSRLEGHADAPMPDLDYDKLWAWVLANHPDVLQARNLAEQAKLNLKLAKVTPVPDLQLYGTFQRDFTAPNFERTSYNMQFGVPLPIFDRNQGNIMTAEGRLRSASQQIRVARNSLATQLADAFERFQSSRVLAEFYRNQILPDLVRAYRGVYERHQQEPTEVGFGDVIVAQQNLAAGLTTYISTLGLEWTALTDIAHLLQLDDMRQLFSLTRCEVVPPGAPLPPGPGALPGEPVPGIPGLPGGPLLPGAAAPGELPQPGGMPQPALPPMPDNRPGN